MTYLDELIAARWPWLPREYKVISDEQDACLLELPNGIPMGINRSVETWWRNRPDADKADKL